MLLVSEVMELAGIGRSGLYRRMTAGTFPRPVRLGVQRVAWRRSDVEAWIAAQPASGMGGGLIINRG